MMPVILRTAVQEDIPAITALFRETITTVNVKDYSPEQIRIWSAGADNTARWAKRIREHYFLVAEARGKIAGWAYVSNGNYFDGLYVHKDEQQKGIASLFLHHFEHKAQKEGYTAMHSDVSITALPFFQKHGYTVVKKQHKEHGGIIFENFIVEKRLV